MSNFNMTLMHYLSNIILFYWILEKGDFGFEDFDKSSYIDDSIFCKSLRQFCESGEKPDIGNHRILLWKAMEKFPDVVEPRNKIVVPLLFRLMA